MSMEPHSSVQIASGASSAPESFNTIPCTICRRQFSRYSCPRCNIPYCSLTCFRSEDRSSLLALQAHAQCSETFYREEIESDVHSAPSKTAEERRAMIELLKRFEEDARDDVLGDPSSDDESQGADDELARRLVGLDFESASYDELWAALTPAERDRFLRALGDPSSELAQELLTSADLQSARVEPWWTTAQDDPRITARTGDKPSMMRVPAAMVNPPAPAGPPLLYNICAICIAYAYTTRHLAISPLSPLTPADAEFEDARRTIAHLVPFLTDRKSKRLHSSLSSVATDLWSRFEPNSMTPAFFALLLRDAATLLQPSVVTVLSPATPDHNPAYAELESHPSADTLRVFSDLSSLFGASLPASSISGNSPISPSALVSRADKPKTSATTHKLIFYAGHVLRTPTPLLRAVVAEVAARAEAMEREDVQTKLGSGGAPQHHDAVAREGNLPAKPRIEELP